MAGKRVVHVWREHLIGSRSWPNLDSQTQGAYLMSLCMLTVTEEGNPLRGCLTVGRAPMMLDDWRRELKIYRLDFAKKCWETLLDPDVNLFELVTISGDIGRDRQYVRCVNFGVNQDRLRRAGRGIVDQQETPEDSKSARSEREVSAKSARSEREVSAKSAGTDVDFKRLTTEKSASRGRHDHDHDHDDRRSSIIDHRRAEIKREIGRKNNPSSEPTLVSDMIASNTEFVASIPATLWTATKEELAEICNNHEPRPSGATLQNWKQRVGELSLHVGGVAFLRDCLQAIDNSQNPDRDDVGEFARPVRWLNKETSNWLKPRRTQRAEKTGRD